MTKRKPKFKVGDAIISITPDLYPNFIIREIKENKKGFFYCLEPFNPKWAKFDIDFIENRHKLAPKSKNKQKIKDFLNS